METNQEALVRDIIEVTHMLNREMSHRVRAETYGPEAVEIVEELKKTTVQQRKMRY